MESVKMPLPEDFALLEDWNDAYRQVESYFGALRIRNKLVLSRLVYQVLTRVAKRLEDEPKPGDLTPLVAEETDRLVEEWFIQILGRDVSEGTGRVSEQGRLALLLSGVTERWQARLLSEPPWPEEMVASMRAAYLRAGPDFQISQMTPRPIDLGPVSAAARTLQTLEGRPFLKMFVVWSLALLGVAFLFFLTR